jgi:hypothetical protein
MLSVGFKNAIPALKRPHKEMWLLFKRSCITYQTNEPHGAVLPLVTRAKLVKKIKFCKFSSVYNRLQLVSTLDNLSPIHILIPHFSVKHNFIPHLCLCHVTGLSTCGFPIIFCMLSTVTPHSMITRFKCFRCCRCNYGKKYKAILSYLLPAAYFQMVHYSSVTLLTKCRVWSKDKTQTCSCP